MTIDHNAAAGRVLDAVDVALDCGPHGAVLQSQIGIVPEGTVHQGQVLAVAKRLRACDVAADEGETPAVPGQVLAVDFAVGDGDVLAVPECVLAVEQGVAYLNVLAVLEGVVALEVQTVDADVVGSHTEIIGIQYLAVLYVDAVAVP